MALKSSGKERNAAGKGEDARASLYDDARVYDILHGPGTGAEVRGLLEMERRFVTARLRRGAKRVWVEPACGSGRYLLELVKREEEVRAVGVDLEAGMVEFARARAARMGVEGRVEFVAGDMTRMDRVVPRASFGFCLINSVRHLVGERAMREHLRSMGRVLEEGGAYAVGLSLSAYGREEDSEDVWRGRRGAWSVSQVVQYVQPAAGLSEAEGGREELVVSHLTIRRERADGREEVEHRDSSYRLRCYNLSQWRATVRGAGLKVVAVVDERGREMEPSEPGYAIWILTR